MKKTPYQIYDILFKKILTLSSAAVIHLINGLFNTNYDIQSTIRYNWTEFSDDALRRTLADTIITINETHSYHMEAQMTEDEDIIFRIFDYGYGHARHNSIQSENACILNFPEPKIIYLYYNKNVPDEYTLTLNFGTQGTFDYKVSTFKFLDTPIEELDKMKMIILIPFALLKLRKMMEKERSPENLEALKSLIQDDILQSINSNMEAGNITEYDASRLRKYTQYLYEHIYSHYEEMEEVTAMTDETILFDVEILIDKLEKLDNEIAAKSDELTKINDELAKKDIELVKKDNELVKKDNELVKKNNELVKKDNDIKVIIKSKNEEIASLKKQLEELQQKSS